MTTGTPNCKTLAVMAISAMPPAEVPKIRVAGCKPVLWAKNRPNPSDKSIMATAPKAAVASQRGAVCTNSR